MIYELIRDTHAKASFARKLCIALAIGGFLLLAYLYPMKAEVTLAKVLILLIAAIMCYVADRILFPSVQLANLRKNVEEYSEQSLLVLTATIQIRRAILFLAIVFGLCLSIV
jgi:hypothetical protein